MKLSVMLYSFANSIAAGQMTVAQVCRFLSEECDVDAIEPEHHEVDALGVGPFKKLMAELDQHVACYIGGGDFVVETDQQGPAIDASKAAIEMAVELDCNLMLLTTGDCRDGISEHMARQRIAAGLKQVIPYAKDRGVTVTIEPTGYVPSPHGKSDELLEVLALTGPELMLTYDNGNLLTQGEDPNQALGKVWDRVAHVHLKDWRKIGHQEQTDRFCVGAGGVKYQGEICGQGLIDYPANIAELKRRGYNGYLSLEYEGVGDPQEAVKTGLANIRRLLQS